MPIRVSLKEILIVFIFALLTSAVSHAEMRIGISSDKLFPGDAFSVNVSGVSQSINMSAAVNGLQIPLAECAPGRLCGIGVIPAQTTPGKTALIVRAGTELLEIPVTVKKAEYPERHIRLPRKKVDLSHDDLERAGKEAEKLKALWHARSNRLFQEEFVMPLPNPVSTGYGVKRIFNRKKISVHQGIDIRGKLGEEVKASNSGIVIMAENLFFGGNTLILDHGTGIFTVYMHLDSFKVKSGIMVEKGQTIGLVGSTGRSSGPHLHLSLKILNISANPLSIMNIAVR